MHRTPRGLKADRELLQVIYSGGMDVDILPKGASKGDGLKFLLREARSFFFSLRFLWQAQSTHLPDYFICC